MKTDFLQKLKQNKKILYYISSFAALAAIVLGIVISVTPEKSKAETSVPDMSGEPIIQESRKLEYSDAYRVLNNFRWLAGNFHSDICYEMNVMSSYSEEIQNQSGNSAYFRVDGSIGNCKETGIYYQSADVEITALGTMYTDHLEMYIENTPGKQTVYNYETDHWNHFEPETNYVSTAYNLSEEFLCKLVQNAVYTETEDAIEVRTVMSLPELSVFTGIENFMVALVDMDTEFYQDIPLTFTFTKKGTPQSIIMESSQVIHGEYYLIPDFLFSCYFSREGLAQMGIPEDVRVLSNEKVLLPPVTEEIDLALVPVEELPLEVIEETTEEKTDFSMESHATSEEKRIYSVIFGPLPVNIPTGAEFLTRLGKKVPASVPSEISDIMAYLIYSESYDSLYHWYTEDMWEYNTDKIKQAIVEMVYVGVIARKDILEHGVEEAELDNLLSRFN